MSASSSLEPVNLIQHLAEEKWLAGGTEVASQLTLIWRGEPDSPGGLKVITRVSGSERRRTWDQREPLEGPAGFASLEARGRQHSRSPEMNYEMQYCNVGVSGSWKRQGNRTPSDPPERIWHRWCSILAQCVWRWTPELQNSKLEIGVVWSH